MRSIIKLSLAICLVSSPQFQAQTRGWRGIVPLHSTRQEVEKLLGPSHGEETADHCRGNDLDGVLIEVSKGASISGTLILEGDEPLSSVVVDAGKIDGPIELIHSVAKRLNSRN